MSYDECVSRIDSLPTPSLDVRDLRVVLAVQRAKTTAAAAELLHLTQSAVSRALAAAETHAGVALFDRSPRGLEPTAAGRLLIDEAPKLLGALCSVEHRLKAPQSSMRRIRVVASCAMIYPWLTRAIVRLERASPDIRIDVRPELADHVAEGFEAGKLDAAFVTGRPPPGLPREAMFEDELVFVAAADHPLAQRDTLDPDALLDQVLLVPNARSEDDWFLRSLFGRRRPRLRVRRLPITEAMIELARAGFGIAVLSEWIIGRYLEGTEHGLRVLRPSHGPLLRKWSLVHRPEIADVAPQLRDMVLACRPSPRSTRSRSRSR